MQLGIGLINRFTMPLKAAIIPYLDSITPESDLTGAVNTVVKVREEGKEGFKLVGTNTDFLGASILFFVLMTVSVSYYHSSEIPLDMRCVLMIRRYPVVTHPRCSSSAVRHNQRGPLSKPTVCPWTILWRSHWWRRDHSICSSSSMDTRRRNCLFDQSGRRGDGRDCQMVQDERSG